MSIKFKLAQTKFLRFDLFVDLRLRGKRLAAYLATPMVMNELTMHYNNARRQSLANARKTWLIRCRSLQRHPIVLPAEGTFANQSIVELTLAYK